MNGTDITIGVGLVLSLGVVLHYMGSLWTQGGQGQ